MILSLSSHQVMWDFLQPCGLQLARLPCPSPCPGVCPSSCPLSRWCHPTTSSSVALFSCQHQGLFQWVSCLLSGGQSIGASASASILPKSIQGWFPLRLTDWISLLSKGLSRVFSNTTVWKRQFISALPSLWSSSHICTWLLEKP